MRLRIHPGFFVVAVLLGSSRIEEPLLLAEWVAVVFVSVLVHELGHAWAFKSLGVAPSIALHMMGGTTSGEIPASTGRLRRAWISLAGPAVGFVLGGFAWLVRLIAEGGIESRVALVALDDLVWANVGWGAANLLPIPPLDGSGALRALLPDRDRLVTWVGFAAAASLVLLALALGERWAVFMALWLAISFAQTEWRARRSAATARRLDDGFAALRENRFDDAERIARELLVRPPDAWAWSGGMRLDGLVALARGEPARAQEALQRAFDAAPSKEVADNLAFAVEQVGDLDEAQKLLAGPAAEWLGDPRWQALEASLFHGQRYEVALDASARRFDRFANPDAAYNAACSLAKLGRGEEAIQWLERAVSSGYRDWDFLAGDEDLAVLRPDARFQAILERRTQDP